MLVAEVVIALTADGSDAIGDWLRRQGKGSGVSSVQQIDKEMIRPYLKSLGEEITIDPDATIIEADKREAQWIYRKVKGYQPLLAYVNEVCIHYTAGSPYFVVVPAQWFIIHFNSL